MRKRTGPPVAVASLAIVTLLACEADPAGLASFQSCDVTDHVIGITVSAHLDPTDCTLIYRGLEYGEFVHYYGFELAVTRTITIRMTSDEIDPKLIVWRRATLQIVAEDDDGGPALDARITRSFGPGRYVIGASSFTAGETGGYTLTTE